MTNGIRLLDAGAAGAARGSNQDNRPASEIGPPNYWWPKSTWVRLSHEKRALLVTSVLAAAAITFVTVAFVSAHQGGVHQPALRCWPTITVEPRVVHAGDSIEVSSNGFQCNNIPPEVPGEYWIQASSRSGRIVSAHVKSAPRGAFTVTTRVVPDALPGQHSLVVDGPPIRRADGLQAMRQTNALAVPHHCLTRPRGKRGGARSTVT